MSDGVAYGRRLRRLDDILLTGAAQITDSELSDMGERIKDIEFENRALHALTEAAEAKLMRKHGCPDWDGLVIQVGDPEMECCTCWPMAPDIGRITPEDIKNMEGYPSLGPAYRVAGRVAERAIAKMTPDMFKPVIDGAVAGIRDKLWDSVLEHLMVDVEVNISSSIRHLVDQSVSGLLSGAAWANKQYVFAEYNAADIRAAICSHVPAELQDARVLDLEKEVATLKARLKSMEAYR